MLVWAIPCFIWCPLLYCHLLCVINKPFLWVSDFQMSISFLHPRIFISSGSHWTCEQSDSVENHHMNHFPARHLRARCCFPLFYFIGGISRLNQHWFVFCQKENKSFCVKAKLLGTGVLNSDGTLTFHFCPFVCFCEHSFPFFPDVETSSYCTSVPLISAHQGPFSHLQ